MIAVRGLVGLAAYAVLLSVVVPAILRRASWVLRAPNLAIELWQALSAAWVLSLVLAGLTLARPGLLRLAHALGAPPAGPRLTLAGLAVSAAGLTLAAGILARVAYVLGSELVWARRQRRAHAAALAIISRPAGARDATIVEHQSPAVYCLPAREQRARIVVTTGALGLLDGEQLAAVLEHERGHLRARHHLLAAVAGALSIAFPGIPLLRDARHETALLAEMAADDHARRKHSTAALAAALLALATAQTPKPALGAGGHTVRCRLERMLNPRPPLRPHTRLAAALTAAGSLTVPIGLACSTVAAIAVVLASAAPS